MIAFTRTIAAIICGCATISACADDPDPVKIVTAVDAATKAVKSVSYKARVWTEGEVGVTQPEFDVQVKTKEAQGGALPWVRIEGSLRMPDSLNSRTFMVILNEKQAAVIDNKDKTYRLGDLPEGLRLVGDIMQTCVMREFVHPTPFADELNASNLKYLGKRAVAGVECHMIHVSYRGDSESRWYFGVQDNLPRRVDRIGRTARGVAARVLELSELDVSRDLDASAFAIEIPSGYQEKQPLRQIPSSPGLLPVGTPAPDWSLKTPDGKQVVLSQLRGKVVLMDFWATWCQPCRLGMPILQKLHEAYGDKPFLIYGISTWERGDPVRFMQQEKYSYGLLLNGDTVAQKYGVRGIPTLYLIGPDGKVAFALSGFDPTKEKILKELIDDLLKQAGNP